MKILLDVCCAPCAIPAIEKLEKDFPNSEIILYSNNSNIHPKEEYERRVDNIGRIAEHYKKEFIVDEYNPAEWKKFVKAEGFEAEKEGGKRCEKCYEFRLRKAAKFAIENGFDAFASTLTTGPPKQAKIINPIGMKLAAEYNSAVEIKLSAGKKIKFIEEDFKKNNGGLRSSVVSKELGLYRQDYCGCEYSRK